MDKELRDWLEMEFGRSNLPKYLKYMNEWLDNLTDDQINGFQKCMEQSKMGSLRV